MEQNIWSGLNSNSGEFDGFEVLLAADAELPAGQQIAAVAGGVDAGNVIAELEK